MNQKWLITYKELIGEFLGDWDLIYSRIYKYLYNYKQNKLKDLDSIITMIYFYHISRRKKWEAMKK